MIENYKMGIPNIEKCGTDMIVIGTDDIRINKHSEWISEAFDKPIWLNVWVTDDETVAS